MTDVAGWVFHGLDVRGMTRISEVFFRRPVGAELKAGSYSPIARHLDCGLARTAVVSL